MKRILKVYSDGQERIVIVKDDHREINPTPLGVVTAIGLTALIWFVVIVMFGR